MTKKTTKFRRQFDNSYKPEKGIVNKKPSQTRPDMSIGIKQLLINHTRGIHSDIKSHTGIFTDDDVPTFLDLTERDEYHQDLIARKNALEAQILQEREDKALQIAKRKKDAADKAKMAKNDTPTPTTNDDKLQKSKTKD